MTKKNTKKFIASQFLSLNNNFRCKFKWLRFHKIFTFEEMRETDHWFVVI